MAKDEKDVKGIMEAIQNVLAEHDIDQARVVLELYDREEQNAHSSSSGTQREVEVVIADPTEPHEAVKQGVHGATLRGTATPASDTEVEDVTPLVVITEKEQPPQSPEKQPPLPRVQHNIAAEPPRPQSAVPSIQKTDTNHHVTQKSVLPPMQGQTGASGNTSTATQAPEAVLEATVPVLAQTACPPLPESLEDKADDVTEGPSEIEQVMTGASLTPSALLPESLQRQLAQHEDRKKRTEILNSFVGKSVLLDNKKQREQTSSGQPVTKHFLSSLTMNQGPGSLGSPAKEAGGSRHMTVRLPEAEQLPKISPNKKRPAAAVGKVPVFSILNKESTLLEAGEGGTAHAASSMTRGNSGNSRTSSTTSAKLNTVQLVDTVGAEAERRASQGTTVVGKGTGVVQEHLDSILLNHPSRPSQAEPPQQAADLIKTTQTSTAAFPSIVPHKTAAQLTLTKPTASLPSSQSKVSDTAEGASHQHSAENVKCLSTQKSLAEGVSVHEPRQTSLKQLLKEQEKMEQQSREGLAQHAKIMEKARLSILAMEAKNQQQVQVAKQPPHSPQKMRKANCDKTLALTNEAPSKTAEQATVIKKSSIEQHAANTTGAARHSSSAASTEQSLPQEHKTSSQLVTVTQIHSVTPITSSAQEAPNTSCDATGAQEAALNVDTVHGNMSTMLRPETPPLRPTLPAPRTGIQVLNVTLPEEEKARTEVIEQYSKSPAAAQHISTKDKYAALLSAQQKALDKQTEEEKEYKKLLEKAVEYNRRLGVKDA